MKECKAINQISSAMLDISPKDYIEGMLSAQIVATHHQAMECLKRAMIKDQPFEIATSYRNQAIKLLRTFTAQMEALKKYRTGGQQKMIIEHVHVHKGGQAIVGSVNPNRGEGIKMNNEEQPHASVLFYPFMNAPSCGAKTRKGTPCKSPAMANGRCRMHGGKSPGPPIGNKNALKHGFYTAEAIAERRYVRMLLKRSKDLISRLKC